MKLSDYIPGRKRFAPPQADVSLPQDLSIRRTAADDGDAAVEVFLQDPATPDPVEMPEPPELPEIPGDSTPGAEPVPPEISEPEVSEPEVSEPEVPEPEPVPPTEPQDAPQPETAPEPESSEEDAPGMPLWKKSLISFGICLLVFGCIGAAAVNYFLGLINYQSADSDYFETVAPSALEEEETYEDSYLQALDEAEAKDDLEASPEDLERWNDHIDKITSDDSTYEIPISEDVYNILLIGTDNRSTSEVGRSDVMMIVSINQKTETIHLTSFLRDCYVSIPGYYKTRINHSYAYGGPDLLMETLETNFKIHIDKYVKVDFFSFMDVIDVLGGVWIPMSEEEVKVANKYIWSMNKLLGLEWSDEYLWGEGYGEDGWRLLTGKQALAHARNRFTGSDYERTARQRNIINQVIYAAMESTPATLVDLAQVILPQITTDLTKSEILSYAANIAAYVDYDIVQHQIPAAGTYSGASISGMSVITLDLEDNIQYIQDNIYAGVDVTEE